MNVPNIGQSPGSVVALPRPQDTEVPRVASGSPGSAPAVVAARQQVTTDLRRIAWFDANGDGRIDSRSSMIGGDGTLLLPAREVALPTYSRSTPTPRPARQSSTGEQAPATSAQTQQAVDAYTKYGQTPVAVPSNDNADSASALPAQPDHAAA